MAAGTEVQQGTWLKERRPMAEACLLWSLPSSPSVLLGGRSHEAR